ncbi:MAG: peptidylprolyl isomerase [Rubrivivax sp.]|nr:peptidylprolyl isomerase [Rubrivivax sp.]
MTQIAAESNRRCDTRRVALLLFTAAIAACGGGGDDNGNPGLPLPPPAPVCVASAPLPAPAPGAQDPQVTLRFANGSGVNGDVVLTLNRTQSPLTVVNFLNYVNNGFYNCTVIHRHSPGFVLQGGAYAAPLAIGGTPPLPKITGQPIALEDSNGLSNVRLSIAMARTDQPNSATSQFFINLANNGSRLDRQGASRGYAVFGNITAGADVITAITAARCTFWSQLVFDGECVPDPNVILMSAVQTR